MSRVIVIGSSNRDLTVRLERLPRIGETVSGGEFYTSFGGKGANQAVAAHKAGAEVTFVAKVGRDENGDAMVRHLKESGLSVDRIIRDEQAASGVALIMVDKDGANMIAVAPGANRNLTEEEIVNNTDAIARAQVLLIQLEISFDAVQRSLAIAREQNVTTILNPAPVRQLPKALLSFIDILTPNEVEAGMLTGATVVNERDAAAAAQRLLDAGVRHVIVTLGEKGSLWVTHGKEQFFPPCRVTPVDSTAAGDAFNGALAYALAEGSSMQDAVRFANAAGAHTVTRKGAQSALPTREEIEQLLRNNQDRALF
jgi:ribokinase